MMWPPQSSQERVGIGKFFFKGALPDVFAAR